MSDTSLEAVEAVEVEKPETVVESAETPETDAGEKQQVVDKEPEVSPEVKKLVEELKKTKKATQKRIDSLTYNVKLKEEEAQKLAAELQKYKPSEDAEPNENDFDTFEAYQEAVTEFRVDKKIKEIEEAARRQEYERKQAEVQQAAQKRFETMEADFRKDTPEYDTNAKALMQRTAEIVAVKGQGNQTLAVMGNVLREIDGAPAIINHLGANPDMLDSLVDMSPVNAAFELFKIKQTLDSAPKKQAGSLPQPVTPVKSTGKTVKDLKSGSVLENLGLK